MMELLINNRNIIYVDESSFSNNKRKFKTWMSTENEQKFYTQARFQLVNLLLAVCKNKVIHFQTRTQTTKSEDFLNFLKDIHKSLQEDEESKEERKHIKYCIYADNASIHRTKAVRKYVRESGLNLVFGVPYTPEHNLAELIFADLKVKFYSRIVQNVYVF